MKFISLTLYLTLPNLAHLLITVLEKKLQAAATLDLVIVLDCTGSMEPFIEAAETKNRSFVTSIAKIYPDIQLRIGFVGYRDH